MKKRILFIVLAIIQIMLAIYCICTAENIVNKHIAEISELLETADQYVKDIYCDIVINKSQVVTTSVISIVLNVIIIAVCAKYNVLNKKKLLMTLFVLNFAVTIDSKAMVLQLLTAILLISFRRKLPEDYPDENKEIPILSYINQNKKEIIFTILLVLLYVAQQFIPLPETPWLQLTIIILLYLAIFAFAILAYFREIKEGITALINNFSAYFNELISKFGIVYIIFLISRIITIAITNEIDSVNQQEIEMLPMFVLAPLAIIWAPVVEEALFRGVIRRITKNDTLFIVISGIIFGALHAIGESSLTNIVATTIPYAVLGGYFAYVYKKTGNITESILSHAAFNAIGVLATFMM